MAQRPISRPGEQLICLPHRLWVEIVALDSDGSSMSVDSVSWGDGASEQFDTISR